MEQQQPIDPTDFPYDALRRLVDVLNETNEAFRDCQRACGIPFNGQNFFALTENKELFKALHDKQSEFLKEGLLKILAVVKPAGSIQ
jgi:hypothetical protein